MNQHPIIIKDSSLVRIKAEKACNCACSDLTVIESFPASHFEFSKLEVKLNPELHSMNLDGSNRVVYVTTSDCGTNSIVVMNDAAWNILIAFLRSEQNEIETDFHHWCRQWSEPVVTDFLARLVEMRFLYPSPRVHSSIVEQRDVLESWLHITDRCNLRCKYCFLPHLPVDMSIDTGLASIDSIFRSALAHEYHKIKIKYAGGEPLLRFPLILKLHEHTKRLGEFYNIEYDGIILSNGTLLTEEIIRNIRLHHLGLMVSLDG